jgi:hypothetical protein
MGAIIGIALLLDSAQPRAQQAPIRFECEFHQAGSRNQLRLEFIYDRSAGRAFMVGNAGAIEVLPYTGRELISFVEMVPSGAVQTTSIDPAGRAVHSRHTYVPTPPEFIQSQMLGRCSAR